MRFGFKMRPRSVALFATLWLFIGFALGTLVLLGPVRALVSALRRQGAGEMLEKGAVLVSIALLMLITTAVAAAMSRRVLETRSTIVRWTLPAIAVAAGVGAYVAWMTPSLMKSQGGRVEQVARFTFGPYPEYDRLQELKREGYTAVVSLLHPAVAPFEPQLLARETKNAAAAGITLIHLPMLPWISDNETSLARLRELARSNSGRYYVHCYLGVDRVLVARRIVEQNVSGVATAAVNSARSLRDVKKFERGAVVELTPTTFVTPYPTPEEFVSYVLAANVDHVIALLDGTDADDARRIADEQKIMKSHAVPFTVIPMSAERYDPVKLLAAVKQVQEIPGSKIVHSFFGPDHKHGALSAAFVAAFRTGRAPLLPSIEKHELRGGAMRLVQPHVAVGPRPEASDREALSRFGIRHLVCVGTSCDDRADEVSGNGWRFSRIDAASLQETLLGEGPFYVYGTGAETLLTVASASAVSAE